MLGRLVAEVIAERGYAYPWGDVLPAREYADLFLINLECALTAQTERWRDRRGALKAFSFRAAPDAVETLRIGRVDFASLANNHTADFGMAGLVETVRALDDAGIAHAGASRDRNAAQAPAFLTAAGSRIGVVAFADHPAEWAAGPTSPGINHVAVPDGVAEVERAVAALRRQADLVVCSIHWGPNMRARPTPAFRAFARRVVEAGADLFWGHSAHVPQGIEVWRGKPILYDSGDFVDDYAVDGDLRNDLSALFLIHARPPDIERVELVPVRIDRCQVNRALGADRDWFAERFATLCGELGTRVVSDGERLAIDVAAGRARGSAPL